MTGDRENILGSERSLGYNSTLAVVVDFSGAGRTPS
jgi:hypothetical protein